MKNLIIPMCGGANGPLPFQFQYRVDGTMQCIHAIYGIGFYNFDKIYLVYLKETNTIWHINEKLHIQMEFMKNKFPEINLKNIVYVELEHTNSQADTVYQTILKEHIKGSVCIKDSDNGCSLTNVPEGNAVCVYSLENCSPVDTQHKSYVCIDDNMFVTNNIEKKVVSPYFNCGCYSFADVHDFIDGYEFCKKYECESAHMYLSHIIYYLLLYKHINFRPIIAFDYKDFAIE